MRWRLIKTRFAKTLPKQERLSAVRRARNERGIWQHRFWEHLIRNEDDYARHVEYCYLNPVKHGHVSRVRNWLYSSFHRDVRAGLFAEDWGGDSTVAGKFGEWE
jgi:putative transposase